jgi:hypothetical protein
MLVRLLAVAALLGATLYGEDITIPFEGGTFLIKEARFIRGRATNFIPEFYFRIYNNTSSQWDLKLRLDITRRCQDGMGDPKQSSRVAQFSVKQDQYQVYVDPKPLMGETGGCVLEKMDVSLISAENRNWRISGITGERIDLEKRREIEALAQAKKDAIESERKKRLAAEQKKKNTELEARSVTAKAEQEQKDAEARRKLRANCTTIYQNTIDKKVRDLTVREEEQVRACQTLGLYPPR